MTPVVASAATIAAAISPTNTTNYLELSCVTFNQFYVMTTQHVTRMLVHNTLIQEEITKSDKLLASILPPSMVVRVQKGEKNISFAVQSATILFLDIVSFTPWCNADIEQHVQAT
ncbi:hypothetical protein M9Y10_020604 [Tritrichomonas musculus]|uniref:Guanylate cyclase domain-containing protein n=1 Tax=Tritrichomonas musculus TaxID=1915356 RepID=A0ABR2HE68_9EUKA